ncbi:MAG: RpiB/LacA/LacB family sugar-phosphate isomerase [Actinomycetota bacterium]
MFAVSEAICITYYETVKHFYSAPQIKFKDIRAGLCQDTFSAHWSIEHDVMNVLILSVRINGVELATELVKTFLAAEFSNEE